MTTHHKSLRDVEIKDADKGIVSAVVSTFGVIDSDGDVTSKESFRDGAPVVVSSYGHTSWNGDLPIGKGTLRTTDTETIADLQFFLSTAHGKAAFETIKELGPLQEWSYSLENVVSKRGEIDGQPANFIESVDVKEVSPVLRGASFNTRTLVAKAAGLKFSEHVDAVVAAVDELVERASEVVALRAEKGKAISDESRAQLIELRDRIDELTAEPTPSTNDDEPTVDDATSKELERIYLDLVASNLQGVTPT